MSKLVIFAGNANPELASSMAEQINIPLGDADVGVFSDGEVAVDIQENVRGKDVFIVQSTCQPTNNNLMELLVMADALRRSSAGRITAVIPYFGYARQDRRVRSARVPITAKVVADMITAVGIDRVVTVDLHDLMVVSPDVGGVVRARALAKQLNDADLAIIDKRRPKANESQVMHIIGEVEGRTCVLVDDIVDTAGTLCKAAQALKDHGAAKVIAYCTHPVLSGPAIDNISNSAMDQLVVTDTIPLSEQGRQCDKIRVLRLAPMLAETIRRVNNEESLSAMFDRLELV